MKILYQTLQLLLLITGLGGTSAALAATPLNNRQNIQITSSSITIQNGATNLTDGRKKLPGKMQSGSLSITFSPNQGGTSQGGTINLNNGSSTLALNSLYPSLDSHSHDTLAGSTVEYKDPEDQ